MPFNTLISGRTSSRRVLRGGDPVLINTTWIASQDRNDDWMFYSKAYSYLPYKLYVLKFALNKLVTS